MKTEFADEDEFRFCSTRSLRDHQDCLKKMIEDYLIKSDDIGMTESKIMTIIQEVAAKVRNKKSEILKLKSIPDQLITIY